MTNILVAVETKTLNQYLTKILTDVKNIKFDNEKNVFRFNRKSYMLVDVTEMGTETELTFEKVGGKSEIKTLSYKADKLSYDGFNDKILPYDNESSKKRTKTDYQKEYYLSVLKPKRQAEKAENLHITECKCVICGKVFPSDSKKPRKYCSPECKAEGAKNNVKKFRAQGKHKTEAYKETARKANERRKEKYHNDESERQRRLGIAKKSREKLISNMSEEELKEYRRKNVEKAQQYLQKKKENKNS